MTYSFIDKIPEYLLPLLFVGAMGFAAAVLLLVGLWLVLITTIRLTLLLP